MQTKGVVRKLDPVGRIVIPREYRRVLGLKYGDPIEIILKGKDIILKTYADSCIFCGSSRNVSEFKGKFVCEKCRTELGG